MHGTVAESCIDGTVRMRIMPPVVVSVVHSGMNIRADQFFGGPAENPLRDRIDEGGLAFSIDSVNALACRAQDQLVLALNIAENALDPLPGGDAAAHMVFRGDVHHPPPPATCPDSR